MLASMAGSGSSSRACQSRYSLSVLALDRCTDITSISAKQPLQNLVLSNAARAGVHGLVKTLSHEIAPTGITVNAVCPGPVRTMLAMAVHSQDIIDAYHDAIPLNRYGTERELANVICFLCSDEASYVTGQCIAVDGGFEATGIGLPALRATATAKG